MSDGLINHVNHAFAVFNDRAFMRVDLALLPAIEALVRHPTRPYYAEGAPAAAIHQRLLRDLPEPPDLAVPTPPPMSPTATAASPSARPATAT